MFCSAPQNYGSTWKVKRVLKDPEILLKKTLVSCSPDSPVRVHIMDLKKALCSDIRACAEQQFFFLIPGLNQMEPA